MYTKIVDLFNSYINRQIDIYELQNRITTLQCNDSFDQELILFIDNEIESIIFGFEEENYYQKTVQLYNIVKEKIN